jgi:methyl-accepting chemotaxis protein
VKKVKTSYISFIMLLLCFITNVVIAKFLNNWIVNLGLGVVFAIIGTLLLEHIYKTITQDIKGLVNRINENDLMIDIDRDEDGPFGGIIKEIKKMVEGLKDNFRQQVNMSTQITKASDELNKIAAESAETMANIQSFAEVTCDSSEKQVQMVQEISISAKEIVDTLINITDKMNETSEFTEESINAAQQGINATSSIKNKMAGIRDSVTNAAEQIESLKEYSDKVVNMTGLINSIAQQTNMLALNASIEAARAGEHGRGFSVVADEVGKLSNQTTQVSNQISEVVDTLQKEILSIANLMKQETRRVEEGYIEVENTITDLNKINDSLRASVDKVKQMGEAVNNVSANGEEVAAGIEEISQFSSEIYAQMEESQAQTNLQNQKFMELKMIADKLSKDSDEMQQQVANKVMEGKMLKAVDYIANKAKGKQINDTLLNEWLRDTGMDLIYITDRNGVTVYCNDKPAIGLDLYKIDASFIALREGKIKYTATPIKKRIEDEKLFKFLAIIDDGIIYQVALSIESLIKF